MASEAVGGSNHKPRTQQLPGEMLLVQGVNSAEFVRCLLDAYIRGVLVSVVPHGSKPSLLGIKTTNIVTPNHDHGWHAFEYEPSESTEAAHVAFTSGTTGSPKAIVLSHLALADVVQRLNATMQIDSSIREYVGVPVHLSFGFGRCRAVAAVAGKCFLPEHGFNPLEVSEMIERGEINAISAVPTQWRILLQNPSILKGRGARIRWIEIGSQYMSRQEKEQVRDLFPNANIVQHYGLTEASRTTFLEIHRVAGHELESVGKPVGRTEVRLSEEGRIQIRGPHVALGEVRDGELVPLTDESGWLTTNDLGNLVDGNLFFTGRADDLINCGGTKIAAELFESELLSLLQIDGGLAVGPAADPLRGQVILIALEPSLASKSDQIRRAAAKLGERFGLNAAATIRIDPCDELPRTASGKIKRNQLEQAVTNDTRLAPADGHRPGTSIGPPDEEAVNSKNQLVTVWQQVLGMSEVPRDRSFYELGGDSLTAVAAMLQMEKMRLPASITRRVFEGKTLQQLFDEIDGVDIGASVSLEPIAVKSNVINATRGVLVLLVIAVHWLPGVWSRLPDAFADMDSYLRPVYRMGTPGFALVFGLGLGFFQLPLLRNHPRRLRTVVKRNALILAGGITLLAVAKAGANGLSPLPNTEPSIVSSFYSVLIYYLFAIVATPALLRPIVNSSAVVATCLLFSMICFALGAFAKSVVTNDPTTGVVEVVRLMLIAKYNIFDMTGIVMLGTAIGAAYRRTTETEGSTGLPFFRLGLATTGFGLLTCHATDGMAAWMSTSGKAPWALITYTGVVMILCSVFQCTFSGVRMGSIPRRVCELLVIIGMLALPAFVLHESVIPIKDIISELGMPSIVALAIPLTGFFAILTLLYVRLNRVYFATLSRED
ncbi:AMP-binding protein [Aeoliella sp. ICT_H6.2]|uniref:AMP-binding protein n=1 Tax=Aeoliella straminimaris TaxID=2954799 RepID=A0A9X2FAN1_9BACT|nr:AMP-binding protein [Aeoliella straminimaris]MCO6045360.1 AMP-binding protein [Aeoliella straminimaris]